MGLVFCFEVWFFFFYFWKGIPLQYTATGQLSIQMNVTGHTEQLFIRVKVSRESVSCYFNQPINKAEGTMLQKK